MKATPNHHGPGVAASELAHQDHVDLPPLSPAIAHAVVTPTSEKSPDAANVGGPVQTETQYLIFDQPADDGKQFATLRVHLALKVYMLSCTAPCVGPVRFNVTRSGMACALRNLSAVTLFLDQVGGAHA